MQFSIYCLDNPATPELRPANRDAHLAYVAQVGAAIKVAGPLTDEHGTPVGSLLIVDVANQEAADPYTQAKVFESSNLRPFKWLITDGKRV
jgi:hypothetical protein